MSYLANQFNMQDKCDEAKENSKIEQINMGFQKTFMHTDNITLSSKHYSRQSCGGDKNKGQVQLWIPNHFTLAKAAVWK